jgi:hypothetical protein
VSLVDVKLSARQAKDQAKRQVSDEGEDGSASDSARLRSLSRVSRSRSRLSRPILKVRLTGSGLINTVEGKANGTNEANEANEAEESGSESSESAESTDSLYRRNTLRSVSPVGNDLRSLMSAVKRSERLKRKAGGGVE